MIIIDCEIIQKINEMLLNNKTLTEKKHTINDIKLRSNNNLLMKYIKSNHRSDINANDINEMAKIGLDFKKKNDNDYHALDLYCKKSKGELNKSVIEALIMNYQYTMHVMVYYHMHIVVYYLMDVVIT